MTRVTREGATRPAAGEHAPYYTRYVERVPDGPILETLKRQLRDTVTLLSGVGEARGAHRYAPGKWSVKQVLGHVTDVERVFAVRALAFSRGERARIFGIEQDEWVAAADFDRRPLRDLLTEHEAVRRSSLLMFDGFSDEQWLRRGVASDVEFTVRSIPWILAGHELHHVAVLSERYLAGRA